MISVCVATHNGEDYIKEQLDSILCQLGEDDEVVISDDGSTDNTLGIIESLSDKRIKVFKTTHKVSGKSNHYYVTRNFVNALQNAKGDIIFLSDQDDRWRSNKVEVCMEALKDCDLVVHNFCNCDDSLEPLMDDYCKWTFKRRNYLMADGKYFGCAMAFKRSVLQYVLPIPSFVSLHDFWIGILTEILGEVVYIEQDLIDYRIRACSASHSVSNTLFNKITYRLQTMVAVWTRVIICKIKR